jgi:hypothetical protein
MWCALAEFIDILFASKYSLISLYFLRLLFWNEFISCPICSIDISLPYIIILHVSDAVHHLHTK